MRRFYCNHSRRDWPIFTLNANHLFSDRCRLDIFKIKPCNSQKNPATPTIRPLNQQLNQTQIHR